MLYLYRSNSLAISRKVGVLVGASVLGSYWWTALVAIAAIVGFAVYNSTRHQDRDGKDNPGSEQAKSTPLAGSGSSTESKVVLAPRLIRVLNFGVLSLLVLTTVFIAVYPPIRLVQTLFAGVASIIALIATVRVLRAGYVLSPTTLKVRGLIVTQTIPKNEIASFPTAGVVERRDHWGGTTPVVSAMFREDRLGRRERSAALNELRSWLGNSSEDSQPELPH